MALDSLVMLANYRRRAVDDNLRALDCYKLVLRTLVMRGELGRATMVFLGPREHLAEQDGVQVQVITSFRHLPRRLLSGDVLLVRADRRAYLPALARGRWSVRMFYPASATWFPRRTSGYDVLLVDEEAHAALLAPHFPDAVAAKWVKTADPAVFHPLDGVAPGFDVCCFGHMDKAPKNYGALPAIVGARPGLRYLVIGRKEPGVVEKLDALEAQVHYAGAVAAEEANRLLARSRLALVLSERDGAPRTILEAMAAGVPQVVNAALRSGTGYIREGAGLVAPLAEFPAAIDRILAAPGEYAPARVFHEHFSPDRAADALMAAALAGRDAAHPGRVRQRLMHTPVGSWLNARRRRDLARKVRAGAWT